MNYDLCLHMDADDPAALRLTLKNAFTYLKALPDKIFQLVLVANGPGVRQFVLHNADGAALAAPLQAKGLHIRLCANALADNNLTPDDLWPGCRVVPAGLVEIVRLQRKGFAYIKP